MLLFPNQKINVLPFDGEAIYYGSVFSEKESLDFFSQLTESIQWKNDEVFIYGKHITTRRKTAWYGDKEFAYTYSKITRTALPWNNTLAELKNRVEKLSSEKYNSCLLNLYHDGSDGMTWHSDDEETIVPKSAIASLSFGAPRKFAFKHKTTGQTVSLTLENGSILVMKGDCQNNWLHSIPKSKTVLSPRINLTFRCFHAGA